METLNASEITENLIKQYFPFDVFRKNQLDIIKTISDSLISENIKYFILEAPTGIGKSVIAMTSSLIINKFVIKKKSEEDYGPDILILTSTKQLQNQYIESFKNVKNTSFIWSSQNYSCIKYSDSEEEDLKLVYYGHPLCNLRKCESYQRCPYVIQRQKFLNSNVGITNYQYFLNNKKLKPTILICDEAHNISNMLCDHASLTCSERILKSITYSILKNSSDIKTINIDILNKTMDSILKEKNDKKCMDKVKTYVNSFIKIFNEVYDKLQKEINKLSIKIGECKESQFDKLFNRITNLNSAQDMIMKSIEKCNGFIESEVDWVISEKDFKYKKIIIKPLYVNEFYNNLIDFRICKCIFMSATICGFKEFANELNISEEIYDSLKTENIIPVENRLVYFCNNIGGLNYQNKQVVMPKIVSTIDRILKYQFKKEDSIHGIIHTVSKENAKFIIENSDFNDHMITPTGEQLMELPKIIKDAKKNLIIVSASILEGIDLIDELSRFQIFIKVPYMFLGDAWVKRKCYENNRWYNREAIIKIVQGSGRSIRSETDWAETFILDSNFNRLLNNSHDLFPDWFLESIKRFNI